MDDVLAARGFGVRWSAMVHSLLASGKTSVLLNGVPDPFIQCKQGLRQGDPLSLYLFLIVADLLHRMVDDPGSGLLHPLVDDLPCPVVQYVDDTLLLLRAEEGPTLSREGHPRQLRKCHWPPHQLPQKYLRAHRRRRLRRGHTRCGSGVPYRLLPPNLPRAAAFNPQDQLLRA